MTEQLQATGSREMQQLWTALAPHVDALLEVVIEKCGQAADGAHDDTRAVSELEAVVELIRCTVGAEGVSIVSQLLHVAAALHDVIFELDGEDVADLQDAIVCMCEEWWQADRPGREGLVPQAIAYVLVRALGADATNADVRRVCALRGALGAIDFDVHASSSLKKLLLHALICPRFLRHADGRRFLVGLFALSDRLVGELHAAIKNQLPVCRPSLRASYSHLYARAWRAAAGGPSAVAIEATIQELMLGAVHARTSAMASALRGALVDVHALQGTAAAADAMLARLYAPILWRALKAPNPLVRRNAAALFFDVFPLAPILGPLAPAASASAAPRAEADESAERQWAMITTLLADDVQAVRALAAHGAARALALHGGSAPAGVPKALVTRLAAELAHDASSAAVRFAALEALRFLVESTVTPGGAGGASAEAARGTPGDGSAVTFALRDSLPAVGSLAHDSCERVRGALFSLLAALRRVRSPAWTSLVSADMLARRLPLERSSLRAQLSSLLLSHYMPPTAAAAGAAGAPPGGGGTAGARAGGFAKLLHLLKEQPLVACMLLERAPAAGTKGSTTRARLAALLIGLLREQVAAPGGGGGADAEAAASAEAGGAEPAECEALVPPLVAIAALLDGEFSAAAAGGAPATAVAAKPPPPATGAAGGATGHGASVAAAVPSGGKVVSQVSSLLTPELADALWARMQGSSVGRDALRRIAARLPEGAMPAVTEAVTADCAAAFLALDAPGGPASAAAGGRRGADAEPRLGEGPGGGMFACVCAWDRAGSLLGSIRDALAMSDGDAGGLQAGGTSGAPAAKDARAGKRQRAPAAAAAAARAPAAGACARASLARAGHAAGLLLELLGSARLRAELLGTPHHRAALRETLALLGLWLPRLAADAAAPPPERDETQPGAAAPMAPAHAALQLLRAHAKLSLHFAALPPGAADKDDDDAAEPPAAARPARGVSRTGKARAGAAAGAASADAEEAELEGAGGARAAGIAGLLAQLRWAEALASTTRSADPAPAALGECNGPEQRRARTAEGAEAQDDGANAAATAWVCAALVVCATAAAEAAALGLCADESAAAEGESTAASSALAQIAPAAHSVVSSGLGLCCARAGGGATSLAMQRCALALSWQLFDGAAAAAAAPSLGGADGVQPSAVRAVHIAVLASAGAPAAAQHEPGSAGARELRAGLCALLSLSANAPQLQPAQLVEALVEALARAMPATGAGARGAPPADAENVPPAADGGADGNGGNGGTEMEAADTSKARSAAEQQPQAEADALARLCLPPNALACAEVRLRPTCLLCSLQMLAWLAGLLACFLVLSSRPRATHLYLLWRKRMRRLQPGIQAILRAAAATCADHTNTPRICRPRSYDARAGPGAHVEGECCRAARPRGRP